MKKPSWLKRTLPRGPGYEEIRSLLNDRRLHTVCQEARCPNIWECFSCGTATFLIMGDRCTRNCRFCAVTQGQPEAPDIEEPERVAEAVCDMKLKYAVITSVTRDDLADGGAGCFAETVRAIRRKMPDTRIEVLIPDFQGDKDALRTVMKADPDVLNHNIETVSRLYPSIRPGAVYLRSLELLNRVYACHSAVPVKSGIMLGLGETYREIHDTLHDLLNAGCRILTLGQYLQPSRAQVPSARFVHPEEFDNWRQTALNMGFSQVSSGPFVRSSYHAKEFLYER